MKAKFKIGDLVRFNNRTPELLFKLELADRKRTRRIKKIVYEPLAQCSFYYLGTNHQGNADKLSSIGFRSFQLSLVKRRETGKQGKPRTKRKYNRKVNV